MRSGSLDYRPLCVKGNTGGRQNPSSSLFSVEEEGWGAGGGKRGRGSSQSVHFGWHFSFHPPADLPFPRYCLVLFAGVTDWRRQSSPSSHHAAAKSRSCQGASWGGGATLSPPQSGGGEIKELGKKKKRQKSRKELESESREAAAPQ